jgi:hypothetical protein
VFHRILLSFGFAALLPLSAVAADGVKITEQPDKLRIEIHGELFTEYLFQGRAARLLLSATLGPIRSVEHTLQSLGDVAKSLERAITDTKKRISDLTAQIGQPFEYEAKLSELLRRQQEITDKLDLTKNQAPAQLAAESANGDMPAQDADGETLRECYESEWY